MNKLIKIHTQNRQKIWQVLPGFLAVILFAFMITGCDSSTDPAANNGEDPPSQQPPPAANEINMDASSFEPANRTIDVGTTITWTNTNNMDHTVTSGTDGEPDGEFDSGTMAPDETFSHTFEEEGTYDYFCTFHLQSGMTGTITVGEGNNDDEGNNGSNDDNDEGNGNNDDDDY